MNKVIQYRLLGKQTVFKMPDLALVNLISSPVMYPLTYPLTINVQETLIKQATAHQAKASTQPALLRCCINT